MSTNPLHLSLLRPPVLHILRAAGFTATRPSVLDTLVDLTSRYLLLLAAHTSRHALLRQHLSLPPPHQTPDAITITDVRLALQDAGALYPQRSEMEEQARGGEEDMRGIEAFLAWCVGPNALEIRRIAGLLPDAGTVGLGAANAKGTEAMAVERPEDFLTMLKKKHAKTRDGEESRWAGTVLGREKEREGGIKIEGWEGMEELGDWVKRFGRQGGGVPAKVGDGDGSQEERAGSGSSSPLSEISAVTAT